jgi:hypothetical protein
MWRRLFCGAPPPAGFDAEDWAAIRRDLAPLDAFERGLRDRAARFVACGDDEERVFAHIEANREHAQRAIRYADGSNSVHVGFAPRRLHYVLSQAVWDPAAMLRYGVLLAELEKQPLSDWQFPGSSFSPAWLRVIIAALSRCEGVSRLVGSPVISQPAKTERARDGPDIRQWLDMLDMAGERYACILDMVFSTQAYAFHAWRGDETAAIAGLAEFMREDPPARAAQIAKLPPHGREAALRWLAREKLARGAFFDVAFAMARDPVRRVRGAAFLVLQHADKSRLKQLIAEKFATAQDAERIDLVRLATQALGAEGREVLLALRKAAVGAGRVIAEIDRALGGDEPRREGALQGAETDVPVDEGAAEMHAVQGTGRLMAIGLPLRWGHPGRINEAPERLEAELRPGGRPESASLHNPGARFRGAEEAASVRQARSAAKPLHTAAERAPPRESSEAHLSAARDPVENHAVQPAVRALIDKALQFQAEASNGQTSDEPSSRPPAQFTDEAIPDAGLDGRGILDLPIGDRFYTARLDGTLKLRLFDSNGKALKRMPSASGADEADFKAAKKALSTAKKEAKEVVRLQTHRFYEAMCGGRDWPAEAWRSQFLEHPIVAVMAQRLVWIGVDEAGAPVTSFRPIEDLTLTDADEDDVELDEMSSVRVAHRSLVEDAAADAWIEHFADNDVEPLFDQFSRPMLRVATRDPDRTLIEDRKGWAVEASELRAVATKLGYVRGPAKNGRFTTYEKMFDELGMCAIVEFSGNSLREQNRTVSLIALKFAARAGARRRNEMLVPLLHAPAVMVSEAWNDFHEMAETGSEGSEDWSEPDSFGGES